MVFLPPFGGVFRLSLASSSPGIPCRRSFGFQGSIGVLLVAYHTFKRIFRTWQVRFWGSKPDTVGSVRWTSPNRAYHNNTQIFRRWYFRFLPLKPEVIVPVLRNIEWINDNFPKTNFSPRNLLIQRPLRCGTSVFWCWISGLGEAQQVFLKSDLKNLIQNLWVGTNSPCLLRLQTRKFLCRKITARFKLNLKTDGLDCKMIFKFWKACWEVS